ncbi:ketosteroid isomerase-related protein [Aphanothece stagnina]|uniref:ketosteroid isomerase-related protein n=1 Tax=Aphanothece stagnina TaxID=1004305 RepID=UPI00398E46A9
MRTALQAVETYFAAFNAHDADALLATLHPNVIHDINEGGQEVGIDAVRAFKAHMDRCYREHISDLVLLTHPDHPTRVAAEFTCSGEYLATDGGLPPATGQTYSIPAAAFFEVKDGHITRVTSYYNLKGWVQAVSPATD